MIVKFIFGFSLLFAFLVGCLVGLIAMLIILAPNDPDEFEEYRNIYDGCDWPSKKDDKNG